MVDWNENTVIVTIKLQAERRAARYESIKARDRELQIATTRSRNEALIQKLR